MERLSYEDKVVRSFIKDGRLVSIPARDKKRLVILRYLRDACFPEDRAYPEKEVNQRLGAVHPDPASLRRYLVDEGFMARKSGVYRLRPRSNWPSRTVAAKAPGEDGARTKGKAGDA